MVAKSNFPIVPIEDVPTAIPQSSKKHRPVVLVVDDDPMVRKWLGESPRDLQRLD